MTVIEEPFRTVHMTIREFTEKYDIVEYAVGENGREKAIIAVDASLKLGETARKKAADKPNYSELGVTGSTSYGSAARQDYNSDLVGITGLRKFDEMRKSSGQVKAGLLLAKTPVLAARWYVEPGHDEDAEPTAEQKEQAAFIKNCLFKWRSDSWSQFLIESLLCLDYGHYTFEKVFAERIVDGQRRIIWQKFAPRHPMDVTQWIDDPNGGPKAVEFLTTATKGPVEIPIEKLIVFTHEKEAGNMQGTSILRSQYTHWFYANTLYKIDAIQKERHGIGIPVIKLPPGYTDKDKLLAQEMGRNLRTNEKAHIVLPPYWEIIMLKLEGQPVNALESAKHHEMMLARTILGQFINSEIGLASTESAQTIFLKATRFVAEQIRDTINTYAIPQLIDYNFPDVEFYPELKVRRIGDTIDWRTVSFAMRNFVGAGLLTPDDPLEKWIRDEMDLPVADTESSRIIVAPVQEGNIPDGKPDSQPGPGGSKTGEADLNNGVGNKPKTPKAGLPRQSNAGNMRKGPGSTKGDRSGG